MIKQKVDDFGLIDLMTWHELQKRALDHCAWYQHFSSLLVDFFQKTFSPFPNQQLLILCADKSRLAMVEIVALTLGQAGIRVGIHLPPRLRTSMTTMPGVEFCKNLDAPNTFAILDCIASLSDDKLTKQQNKFIQALQERKVTKIALDCPSGLNPDTGYSRGESVLKVDYTLCSFYYLKGLWTSLARAFVGQVILGLNAVPEDKKVLFSAHLMHEEQINQLTPKRQAFVHKTCFRRVVVIAGDSEMFGAAIMAAKSALMMGAGLVEVLMPQGIQPPYAELPEVIWHVLSSGFDLQYYLKPEDIIVLGPGLGEGAWACAVWEVVKKLPNSVVLDAQGLAYLVMDSFQRDNWIMTPHPGEAAILLSCSNQRVQENRFVAIRELIERYGMICVLKGSGTLVSAPKQETFICPLGHPGMATPGMGDVLTGLIAGIWAQGVEPFEAAIMGVWIHARAADIVAEHSIHGIVIATELLAQIQQGFGY